MSDVGIITNTVTWFELQPERTKNRVKRDDLDTLTEIYVGPSAYEDTFVPVVGTMHPDYTLMRVITTSVKRLPAAMTEITVNYQGKLANGSIYTSVPTLSKYWLEGEVSYQIGWAAGTATFSRRYTGRCVVLSYITNNVPTGEPTNIGLAKGFMGFQNIWDTMSGFSAGGPSYGGSGPITQMACSDVRVEDRADGWYKVTETYQSRMFPGSASFQLGGSTGSAAPITGTASNRLIDSSTTRGQATNADGLTPDYSAYDFTKGTGNTPLGTATWSAQYGNTTLQTSAPLSIGASTYGSTGMDPAYGSTSNWNDGQGGNAADIYPLISNDSATPGNADVGTTSDVYSG